MDIPSALSSSLKISKVSVTAAPVDRVTAKSSFVYRRLGAAYLGVWGVTPVMSEEYNSLDIVFYQGLNQAKRIFCLESGDNVVLTGGLINGNSGNTNTIKVETVK